MNVIPSPVSQSTSVDSLDQSPLEYDSTLEIAPDFQQETNHFLQTQEPEEDLLMTGKRPRTNEILSHKPAKSPKHEHVVHPAATASGFTIHNPVSNEPLSNSNWDQNDFDALDLPFSIDWFLHLPLADDQSSHERTKH